MLSLILLDLFIYMHVVFCITSFVDVYAGKVHFDVSLTPGTGNFEIVESGAVKASGRITAVDTTDISPESKLPGDSGQNEPQLDLTTPDVYKEFRLRGYDYGPSFQGIIGANIDSKNFSLSHVL